VLGDEAHRLSHRLRALGAELARPGTHGAPGQRPDCLHAIGSRNPAAKPKLG